MTDVGSLRTAIRLVLDISTRWAVGSAGTDTVDLPVSASPSRTPHLPMTSLAGSLREHLRAKVNDQVAEFFGSEPADYGSSSAAALEPSRLWLLGASPLRDVNIHQRGTTAIDPSRRAATIGSLRDEEFLAPARFLIAAEFLGDLETDAAELLDALRSWRPVVGRARSSGLGEATVVCVETHCADLATQAGLHWWLTARDGWLRTLPDALPAFTNPDEQGPFAMKVSWTNTEPLRVGVGAPEREAIGRPEVAKTLAVEEVRIIPGSSWRGSFRHRIGYILDAVGIAVPTRDQTVETLFGSRDRGRGILGFADSRVTGALMERTHVAIDRFAGGARDGALFTVQAIAPGATVTLRVTGEVPPAVQSLLEHVVRDIHDGLIGIGGMTGRGYGSLQLSDPDSVAPPRLDPAVLQADLDAWLAVPSALPTVSEAGTP